MFVIFLPERGSYVGFFLSLLNKHIFSVGILKKKLSIKKKNSNYLQWTTMHMFSPSLFFLHGYRYTVVKRKDADIYDSGVVISPLSSPQGLTVVFLSTPAEGKRA